MQDGLAMEPDNIDILAGDVLLCREGCNGFGMRERDGAFGLAEDAGPGIALRQPDSLGQRLPQDPPLLVAVRPEGPIEAIRLPSVSIKATSTPSSEVPLIMPIAFNIIAMTLSETPGRMSNLCRAAASYNATGPPAMAVRETPIARLNWR